MNPKKTDWRAIQAAINARTGKNYSVNYLQNVYSNLLTSKRVKEMIDEEMSKDKK